MAFTSRLCSLIRLSARPSRLKLHYDARNPRSLCRFSSTRSLRAGSAKVVQTLKNDPFIKLSLSLCVIVLGGMAVMELYNKLKKKASRAILLLPPTFAHHAIKREYLLGQLEGRVKKVRAASPGECPVLYITGPTGCGKTQLLHQYCNQYIESHQYEWLGLKHISPVVLCLDATSPHSLTSSVNEVMIEMGLRNTLSMEDNFSAIMSSLARKQVPWLLVVDNLTDKTAPCFTLLTERVSTLDSSKGTMLVASQGLHTVEESMTIPSRFTREEAYQLLEYAGVLEDVNNEVPLLESLFYHPMATALAAATLNIYQTLDCQNAISSYQKLLMDRTSSGDDVLQAALNLFFEASVSDPCLRHSYDLIGSLDLDSPLLASIIPVHLSSQFYDIPSEQLVAPQPKLLLSVENEKSSYWDYIKSTIPFLQSKTAEITPLSQDEVNFLRNCPVFSFKHYPRADIELIAVNSSAAPILRQLFTKITCPKLDYDHSKLKVQEFEKNAWFRKYRTFDEKNCLAEFHRGLPGLASPGVHTAREFASLPVSVDHGTGTGTKVPDQLQYSEYVHIVSHYHRVTESLLLTLKSVKGEMSAYILEKSLLPHINAVTMFSLLSQEDRLAAKISVTSLEAASLSGDDLNECLSSYGSLLNEQKKLLGSRSMTVARTLTDYADLLLSTSKAAQAKSVLQSVLSNYKQLPVQARDKVSMDVGHTMSSLGHACAQLGESEESKNFYEHALTSYQSAPVQGHVTKKQQKLISSLLIDLAHAHLVLGDLPMGKKYSELGIMVIQSLYPDGNLETVRLLQISSIINSLLGDKEESSKLLAQASKIEAKLNTDKFV